MYWKGGNMAIYEVLQQRINILDIIGEYTELRMTPDGSARGRCPIHGGTNPNSLMVTPKNGTFYCNSCGAGGSVINFIQWTRKFNYNEAIEFLADYCNIDLSNDVEYLKHKSMHKYNEEAAQKYKHNISGCIDYLVTKRGFTKEIIDEFDLGWNSDEKSIVIPIRDHQGRIVAFSRRFLFSEPKYINSRNSDIYDKSKTLFNMDKARRLIKDKLFLVEGYMDAISGHQQGQPTAAYCTSELSREQIQLIKEITNNNPNITILLGADNDHIGEDKIIKMRDKLSQIAPQMNIRVLIYPGRHWSEIDSEEDTIDYYKDFNDLVKAGIKIVDLPSEQIDIFTLKLKLSKCHSIEEEYLVTEQYCKTVQSKMIKADLAMLLSIRWSKPVKEIKDWLDVTEKNDEDILGLFKGVDQCLSEYKEIMESDGLGFGYSQIDASLRGARKSDVVIFGAYSSVGKTFYAIEFVKHMAIRLKQNVMVFSLEMPAGMFMERLIANIIGVSTVELERMVKVSEKWAEIYEQVRVKLEEKVKIVDENNISIKDIDRMIKVANARMLWKVGKTDIVIVDYFQYLKNTSTFETASESARGMKGLAKGNNVLFICLSQLSRQGSPWEKPTMQMLKSTGDLEASADIILMAWRPGLDPVLTVLEKEKMRDIIFVTIAKSRRGATADDFEHKFNREKTRVEELIA